MGKKETFEYYRKIYMRDNYRCVYCNREMLGDIDDWLSLEIDHLKPKSKDGTNDKDNLVTSCNVCNKMKSNIYDENLDTIADPQQKIALIAAKIREKRDEEYGRWVKAIMQYNYYLENKNEAVDDRELKVIRIEK